MNRKILIPAILTFAAGIFAGMLFERYLAPPPEGPLPIDLAAYVTAMTAAAGLSPDQVADLRILMRYYDGERNRLLDTQRQLIAPEWADLDERFETLIRNRILQPEQRARFTNMEAALPAR